MSWHCRYCSDEHIDTTARCPARVLDEERFVRASRWMRPLKSELERWAQARADLEAEALAREGVGA